MPGEFWFSQTFANEGGPLLVLPHEWAGHWNGTADEYRRACDARRPFDMLKVDGRPVLVASSDEQKLHTANWLRVDDQPGIIFVGWEGEDGDGEDEYCRDRLEYRLRDPAMQWEPRPWRMEVRSSVLLLLHAAGPAVGVRLAFPDRSAVAGDAVPVGVVPGRYALETAMLEDRMNDAVFRCVLCRWTPIGSAQQRRSDRAQAAKRSPVGEMPR